MGSGFTTFFRGRHILEQKWKTGLQIRNPSSLVLRGKGRAKERETPGGERGSLYVQTVHVLLAGGGGGGYLKKEDLIGAGQGLQCRLFWKENVLWNGMEGGGK